MNVRFTYLSGFLVLSSLLAAGYGCSATNTSTAGTGGNSGSSSGNPTQTGSGGAGGDCVFNCNTGGATGQGGATQGVIIVSPPTATLAVTVGAAIPTQGFKATFNGNDVTGAVTWSFERPEIGDIGAGSIFTPTGNVGGVGKLTAQLSMAQGAANVTVTIKNVVTGGVGPGQQGPLDNPNGGADPAMKLLYPYDKTVFPLGVLAPELQWNGATAADVYKLVLQEKYYTYVEYFQGVPVPSRHLMGQKDWSNFEDSGAGAQSDPVTMTLTRLSGGTAYQPIAQTWHIAQGRLHGSVYYWELPDQCGAGNGRVLRIKPDSTVTDQFYPSAQCYGCHTVSRDGTTMMASWSIGLPFPQQTLDLTQSPAVIGKIGMGAALKGTFGAFNDKGDKLVLSNDAASNPSGSLLRIVDANTGVVLNPNAMGNGCGEPAWSTDGKKMSAICQLSGGGWVFDASGGNLNIADVDATGTIVTNVKSIVPQAMLGTGRPAYPSFSPGSEHIAFGNPSTGSRSTGNGNLWLVNPDGTNLVKLTTASSDNKSFNPVFAPLRAGGYTWIVFITRRDYGNRLIGANRQQLWITAIDDPPVAGMDPSHPPFYMRGQEDCGKSENAYYALDPCKQVGQGCTSGIDCCGGQCVKDPNTGMYVCGMPGMPGSCSQNGNSCKTAADCCDPSAKCVDGFCQPPIPK